MMGELSLETSPKNFDSRPDKFRKQYGFTLSNEKNYIWFMLSFCASFTLKKVKRHTIHKVPNIKSINPAL